MLRWLLLIALLAAAAAVAGSFAAQPGEVALVWGDYRIASSAAIFVVIVLLGIIAAIIVYQLLLALVRAPGSLFGGRSERRQRRGYEALSRGLVAVAAGDGETAVRQAKRAEQLLDERPLTMLLSAQSAQMRGDEQAAARFFGQMRERPDTEFLGLRGLLTQAMRRHDWSQALQLAERAFQINPKSEWVVSTLYDLHKQAGHWGEAEALLDRSSAAKLLAPAAVARERAELLYKKSLEATGGEALRWAEKACKADPANAGAAARFARLLIADGRQKKAVDVLEHAWRVAPDPELADIYWAATDSDDALKKVKAAQRLAKCNPDHSESRLTIAIAALEARLWGEARTQLESIAGDDASPRICRLMATLEEAEHGDISRARMWLLRAARNGGEAGAGAPEAATTPEPTPPPPIANPVAAEADGQGRA
jgi:HemY protein